VRAEEERRSGAAADAKRRGEGGMGLGARVSGAGRGARGLNIRYPLADPTAGTRRSNGSEEAGRGTRGWSWQAGPLRA
jgi:hypothetical protein